MWTTCIYEINGTDCTVLEWHVEDETRVVVSSAIVLPLEGEEDREVNPPPFTQPVGQA